ncbi:o-succinylbenzoate synthase [Luteipulveratus flavus]|uniref:o-succinylbenzoate synthase n=1 Tax=Luteipulveratus flavus TaxID=3031728 RepID=A0ABT6CBI0_9MICO|nr:o-succinylbenzoate synthase [Luteipulveratus sp. YIM 133296]MDF8264626.1 o-succinylbenzoate synthase [Luteipulveratus sp. YIM 133296]
MTVRPLDELLEELRVVRLPLRTRFRGVQEREIAYVRGPFGWGEFAPFLEYEPSEAARWLSAAIEAAYEGWPSPVRDHVPVNATVPAVKAAEVPEVLSRYDGCRTAKVKVAERGQALQDDLDRVAAVRDVMGADARVRVDANGGWDVDQAVDAIARLAPYGLEYAEQPCATVEDLAALRKALARNGVDVLVAADESIRKAEDPMRVVRLDAADVAVVKVAPLGGVRAALDIATQLPVPVVVSSALDSSVGMAAGVALAAALPDLPFACGLGTVELLAADVTDDSLVPRSGEIGVRPVVVDDLLLDRWAAPRERWEHWMRRIAACHAELV